MNLSQILKTNNHSDESIDDSTELPIPTTTTTSSTSPTTDNDNLLVQILDKRSIDENDQPTSHSNKRVRRNTTEQNWTPPAKEFVRHLQNQSSSLLQFTLSLVNTIVLSSDCQLTDEHLHWLHTTMNSYGHNYNREKIEVLIETACKIAKLNLVR